MEKGGFSTVSRPMKLHDVMKSIFGPIQLDATARGLKLSTSLDLRIDEVAHKAAYEEEGDKVVQFGDGVVMGDEMRLRQSKLHFLFLPPFLSSPHWQFRIFSLLNY